MYTSLLLHSQTGCLSKITCHLIFIWCLHICCGNNNILRDMRYFIFLIGWCFEPWIINRLLRKVTLLSCILYKLNVICLPFPISISRFQPASSSNVMTEVRSVRVWMVVPQYSNYHFLHNYLLNWDGDKKISMKKLYRYRIWHLTIGMVCGLLKSNLWHMVGEKEIFLSRALG